MRKALALLALLLVAGAAQAAPTAWDRVWQSESARQNVSLAGQVRTMMLLGGRTLTAQAALRVAHGKLRLDYQSDGRRWSLIDDGHNLIRLRPEERKAIILPRPPLAFDRSLAERNYVVRVDGSARIAGRRAEIVGIRARAGGPPVWKLWLDRDTAFALKREHYNVDGKLTSSTECLSLHRASVPASIFSIPAGWSREDRDGTGPRLSLDDLSQRVGLAVKQPTYLPPGYVLLGGYVGPERRPGRVVAELRYTDGLRLLTVFEGARRPRGGQGHRDHGRGAGRDFRGHGRGRRDFGPSRDRSTIAHRGSVKVLRYRLPDRVVFVVGDLTENDLIRIAKSLG